MTCLDNQNNLDLDLIKFQGFVNKYKIKNFEMTMQIMLFKMNLMFPNTISSHLLKKLKPLQSKQ